MLVLGGVPPLLAGGQMTKESLESVRAEAQVTTASMEAAMPAHRSSSDSLTVGTWPLPL